MEKGLKRGSLPIKTANQKYYSIPEKIIDISVRKSLKDPGPGLGI